ncbi:MAG TPA: carboxyl transferase domain-containing protein, partial [Solirubrobacteraceae bacterium]|nr:carboxyl transferase domain-containing protein [Solirubrobacteraceae bacterium]
MTDLALARRADEKLSPLERLQVLCDPGSLQLMRGEVRSLRMGDRTRPGDGVIGATGRVDGRPVGCYAQDPSYMGGSLGEVHAETICRVLRSALRARMPVVGFIESAGARLQEGVAALAGYARIFHQNVALSGQVPQISVICGASAGGGSYSPALTDFVVMTRRSSMFLTGPGVVKETMGEDVDAHTLGGTKVHERNGVCQLVAEGDLDAAWLVRDLLDYLPQHAGELPRRWPSMEPFEGPSDAPVPDEKRCVYDVRDVARTIVDGGRLLEVNARWARNIVTGFARLDGRSVGIVANQPKHLGGVLDADAATKGARFVRMCDLYGVPLVVLVDTPGFLPGTGQEKLGVIRHGAKLVHAFSAAAVPRVTVVLRKAFGGAFIAMNSRELGADLVLAWPQAQLGVMGGKQAVDLVHRKAIAAADDPSAARDRFAGEYERDSLSAETAAREGAV